MVKRALLQTYLDELLEPQNYRDSCPNGLHVEGRGEIHRLVCGVSANSALIDAALAHKADAILVHHGYFWRGENPCITGIRRTRLQALLANNINLFAYHLPLDAHPQLGNNAQWAEKMQWIADDRFGEQKIGWVGKPMQETTVGEIAQDLTTQLNRAPLLIGDPATRVRRLAWCSGAAQGYFEQAIASGADLYVSGEISEHTVHLARESGVAYLAAGHHATERYGVQAVSAHLGEHFGIQWVFVDIDNPV